MIIVSHYVLTIACNFQQVLIMLCIISYIPTHYLTLCHHYIQEIISLIISSFHDRTCSLNKVVASVRTSLSRLGSRVCAKRFAHPSISEKTTTGTWAVLDMSKFLSPWQGPHFPVLCPRLGRKHLS